MDIICGTGFHLGNIITFQDVQHLGYGQTAGRRRRQYVDGIAAVRGLQRLTQDGLVVSQVLFGDPVLAVLGISIGNLVGNLAFVENIGAALGNLL